MSEEENVSSVDHEDDVLTNRDGANDPAQIEARDTRTNFDRIQQIYARQGHNPIAGYFDISYTYDAQKALQAEVAKNTGNEKQAKMLAEQARIWKWLNGEKKKKARDTLFMLGYDLFDEATGAGKIVSLTFDALFDRTSKDSHIFEKREIDKNGKATKNRVPMSPTEIVVDACMGACKNTFKTNKKMTDDEKAAVVEVRRTFQGNLNILAEQFINSEIIAGNKNYDETQKKQMLSNIVHEIGKFIGKNGIDIGGKVNTDLKGYENVNLTNIDDTTRLINNLFGDMVKAKSQEGLKKEEFTKFLSKNIKKEVSKSIKGPYILSKILGKDENDLSGEDVSSITIKEGNKRLTISEYLETRSFDELNEIWEFAYGVSTGQDIDVLLEKDKNFSKVEQENKEALAKKIEGLFYQAGMTPETFNQILGLHSSGKTVSSDYKYIEDSDGSDGNKVDLAEYVANNYEEPDLERIIHKTALLKMIKIVEKEGNMGVEEKDKVEIITKEDLTKYSGLSKNLTIDKKALNVIYHESDDSVTLVNSLNVEHCRGMADHVSKVMYGLEINKSIDGLKENQDKLKEVAKYIAQEFGNTKLYGYGAEYASLLPGMLGVKGADTISSGHEEFFSAENLKDIATIAREATLPTKEAREKAKELRLGAKLEQKGVEKGSNDDFSKSQATPDNKDKTVEQGLTSY